MAVSGVSFIAYQFCFLLGVQYLNARFDGDEWGDIASRLGAVLDTAVDGGVLLAKCNALAAVSNDLDWTLRLRPSTDARLRVVADRVRAACALSPRREDFEESLPDAAVVWESLEYDFFFFSCVVVLRVFSVRCCCCCCCLFVCLFVCLFGMDPVV